MQEANYENLQQDTE
ncbi:hypothetical protein CDAR_292741, partial [Caerostris darwini]